MDSLALRPSGGFASCRSARNGGLHASCWRGTDHRGRLRVPETTPSGGGRQDGVSTELRVDAARPYRAGAGTACRRPSHDLASRRVRRPDAVVGSRAEDGAECSLVPALRLEQARRLGWSEKNPVRTAARPKRRRQGDVDPSLKFLTLPELVAVLGAIPNHTVVRTPRPDRRGRAGAAPPPPPDVLGPVLRVVILTAATTGLRQSEPLGLRWREVDFEARRIRVRNAYVRGEHSAEGKSDLSTRRSVPIANVLTDELTRWSLRTVFNAEHDLVFGHPQTGRPLDRTRSAAASSRRAAMPAFESCDSTTSAIRSPRSSRLRASRSGRFKSSWPC